MKRIGYLVLCLCAAARAAVRLPRRPFHLAAVAAPPQKFSLVRILLYRSVALFLDATLLGIAAILLALRFAPRKNFNNSSVDPLLGFGTEEDGNPVEPEQEEPRLEAAEPEMPSVAVQSVESTPSCESAAPSRFSVLREVLFADGFPDLQRIGKRGGLTNQQIADQQHLYDPPFSAVEAPAPARSSDENPCDSIDLNPEEAAVPPALASFLPVSPDPPSRSARLESDSNGPRLERGEPLDGIQILPSRPGQYRRKS